MSKINLTHNGEEYVLEYNRQSVKTMESQGFSIDEISAKPMTMIPALYNGAFIKNHRGIKRSVMDEIFEEIQDKTGFISALMELYGETLSSLTDENKSGNVTWALTK